MTFFSGSVFSQDETALLHESDKGNACAMFDLGTFYLIKPGDYVDQAYKWYTAAAEKGHAQAQENLCEMYFYGVGEEGDLANAVKWCNRAASDKNATDDWKAENKRMGAIWKSDLLSVLHPELEAEDQIGITLGRLSTWNCKSVYAPKEITEFPQEWKSPVGQ